MFLNVLFLMVFSLGCVGNNNAGGDFLEDYSCNSEQLEMVSKEVAICSATTYYSSYCFKQAKQSICLKKKVDEN